MLDSEHTWNRVTFSTPDGLRLDLARAAIRMESTEDRLQCRLTIHSPDSSIFPGFRPGDTGHFEGTLGEQRLAATLMVEDFPRRTLVLVGKSADGITPLLATVIGDD